MTENGFRIGADSGILNSRGNDRISALCVDRSPGNIMRRKVQAMRQSLKYEFKRVKRNASDESHI